MHAWPPLAPPPPSPCHSCLQALGTLHPRLPPDRKRDSSKAADLFRAAAARGGLALPAWEGVGDVLAPVDPAGARARVCVRACVFQGVGGKLLRVHGWVESC